jgi:hypothetical protein
MMIDENTVRTVLADVNDSVFDGELPVELIDIDIDFLDTEWGFCVDEDNRIILGLTNKFRSRKQMVAIIVHEMIHAMQIYNGVEVSHDTALWDHYVNVAKGHGINVNVSE